ncbi:MAG: PIN domain-containing protein [Candidatus Promineifilaceae bacterium]
MNAEKQSVDVCLVDSNVWLYILLPGQDIDKAKTARDLVRSRSAAIVISTQIVNEVVNGIIKHHVMNESEIREFISRFYARYSVNPITESIQLKASQLRERYSLSHWDSLIVSAALQSGVTILFSEDMQDGLIIENQLTINNPFKSQ